MGLVVHRSANWPYNIVIGIVHNVGVPDSLPTVLFAQLIVVLYLDRKQHFVASQPYALIYDPGTKYQTKNKRMKRNQDKLVDIKFIDLFIRGKRGVLLTLCFRVRQKLN